MEYPSKNDFFLRFKTIINEKHEFTDYILVNVSDNFKEATDLKPELLIGRKISEVILENENILFGIKEFYYHMIPKSRRKFEKYIEELDRWYLVNIFSDASDYLVILYTDITKLKQPVIFSGSNIPVYDIRDNLKFHCYRDKLTGLYNKDFFEEELLRLDTKRQLPISIIIGDLNGLKLINDAFGHRMGDNALEKIAEIMKDAFRKEDIISRVGGDEFIVLLPKTTEETALAIVRRMKEDFENNPLDFLKLSMSFGTSTKVTTKENIKDIMRKSEEKMYFNKLTESKEAKINMVKYLKDKLDDITFESKQHLENLTTLSLMMARELDLSDVEQRELKLLCEYHDIGKVGIPVDVLHKKDPLTIEEWNQIKRHSEIGYHIMKSTSNGISIEELILNHHERWDGNGYPGLLKGDKIPITVRIFAIVDAYEAMINYRPYKDKKSNLDALTEIENNAGKQFDPHIAKLFIKLMKRQVKVI